MLHGSILVDPTKLASIGNLLQEILFQSKKFVPSYEAVSSLRNRLTNFYYPELFKLPNDKYAMALLPVLYEIKYKLSEVLCFADMEISLQEILRHYSADQSFDKIRSAIHSARNNDVFLPIPIEIELSTG